MYGDFELNGIEEEKLNTKSYQTISQRMATEEAACVLLDGGRGDDEWVGNCFLASILFSS